MKDVTEIIEKAMGHGMLVPWDEVHRKAFMRGPKSVISDEVALKSETYLPTIGRHMSN